LVMVMSSRSESRRGCAKSIMDPNNAQKEAQCGVGMEERKVLVERKIRNFRGVLERIPKPHAQENKANTFASSMSSGLILWARKIEDWYN